MHYRGYRQKYKKIDDVFQQQITIGSLIYIADYTAIVRNVRKQASTCRMIPRIVDEYWLKYVLNLGISEVDPVPLLPKYVEWLVDMSPCDNGFLLDGTDIVLRFDENDIGYLTHKEYDIKICQVKYIHQLQSAYAFITGSPLDVEKLNKKLTPYRCKERDTYYESENIE